jgi:membrane protease YdiL (CAAX protease family)
MFVNIALIIVFVIALRLERKSLNVFGIIPVPQRLSQLLLGFLLTGLLATIVNIVFATLANFTWVLNEPYQFPEIIKGVYQTFNSVLYEELLFRTYLLYKLCGYIGEKKAVLLSSLAFGVYHWFSYGLIGNYTAMVWILFYSGLWGIMFALAYTRTGSILLTIGLHWGWNFFEQIMFQKNGQGFLKPATGPSTTILDQGDSFLFVTFPTIVFALVVILYLLRTRKFEIAWKNIRQ